MAERAFGIDVSRHQGTMNWDKAAAEGVTFAAIRATIGNYYTDTKFEENWTGAKNAGIYVTAYHVVLPDQTARSQIDRFLDVLGSRIAQADLPLAMDVELDRGESRAVITKVVRQCLEFTEEVANRKPMIYTRASFFNWYVEPSPVWAEYDLWIARYASQPWFGDSDPYKPRDWDTWRFWQYSDRGDGDKYGAESLSIDHNWFNGDKAALDAYVDPQKPPPPTDVPNPIGKVVVTAEPHINVRSSPNVSPSNDLGDLKPGVELYVFEEFGEWVLIGGNVWIKTGPGLADWVERYS
jgi:lysozyme